MFNCLSNFRTESTEDKSRLIREDAEDSEEEERINMAGIRSQKLDKQERREAFDAAQQSGQFIDALAAKQRCRKFLALPVFKQAFALQKSTSSKILKIITSFRL